MRLTTVASQEMTRFHKMLERANRDLFNPAGLNVLSPRHTGFLYVSSITSWIGRTLLIVRHFQLEIEYY